MLFSILYIRVHLINSFISFSHKTKYTSTNKFSNSDNENTLPKSLLILETSSNGLLLSMVVATVSLGFWRDNCLVLLLLFTLPLMVIFHSLF